MSQLKDKHFTDIPLTNNQETICKQMFKHIMQNNNKNKPSIIINNSETGSGKTKVACKLGELSSGLFIICPVGSILNWKKEAELQNIPILFISSYASFRVKKTDDNIPPNSNIINTKHSLLSGKKINNQKTNKHVVWTITEKFIELCNKYEHISFIYDEFQNLKNDSIINNMLATINYYVYNLNKSRHVLQFLSFTPFDRFDCAFNMYRVFGQTNKTPKEIVYSNNGLCQQGQGLYELENHIKNILENKGEKNALSIILDIKNEYIQGYSKEEDYQEYAYELLSRYYFPLHTFSMELNKYDTVQRNILLTPLNIQTLTELNKALNEMSVFIKEDDDNKSHVCFGKYTKNLHCVELLKAKDSIPYIKELLLVYNNKLVIFVNFLDVLTFINDSLKDYQPLTLFGDVKKHTRENICNMFNEPNNNYRVIVCMSQLGVGINLHDVWGNFPRHTLIFANPNLLTGTQCIGRTNRINVKSQTIIEFVYYKISENNDLQNNEFNVDVLELKIFNNIIKKSNILKNIMDENVKKYKLPSDYNSICATTLLNNMKTERILNERVYLLGFLKKTKTLKHIIIQFEEYIKNT